ncbi:MAG: hypothetical protein HN981_00320 [Candidatus Pacebacteria bacterium]|jgi:hypothetical protein|nr:hypothetical protein [Candidatus Paceibacterota bacterium]MBT4651963.1 hypothetical protein [Candidatus Paceibacterota bacterium]MBT6755985.1 hypothetical protein [Candidatus Paceibacterota bacterium]MBT6920827.1 hypothetical protein [Candidatus Paceibacterota bacterium]
MKNIKKLSFAFLGAVLLSFGAVGATKALLQDTEMVMGNTVKGATINLRVGDTDPTTLNFNFNNIIPGEVHQMWTAISSVGGVGGNFWLEVDVSNSLEMDNPEGETDIIGEGELDDCAEVQIVFDDDMGNEELGLAWTPVSAIGPIDTTPSSITDGFVSAGGRMNLQLRTDNCGNEAMGDAFDLDLIFHLDQV